MIATAFADAGWRVLAQVRRPAVEQGDRRIQFITVAVTDVERMVKAARGSSVVVHAINPLYTQWETTVLPLAEAAMDIAHGLDATLMFPGNVYNFGSTMPAVLRETGAQIPSTRKGEIRRAVELKMLARANQGLRSIVIRAGDFFGGPGRGNWFDQAIVAKLHKGVFTYPGPTDLSHAWAYLPDLAKTFVKVAEVRGQFAAFEALHFPGHTVDGAELMAAVEVAATELNLPGAAARPLKLSRLPWGIIGIVGLVMPLWRELWRMRYLWHEEHHLSGKKLRAAIGEIPHTPLDEALRATLHAMQPAESGPSRRAATA
jgi:nucleoside-diphosphate-sugar epimerase